MKNIYQIIGSYSFYPGTFYAPKNGALKNENGDPLSFSTREEAEEYLTDLDGMGLKKNSNNSYSWGGVYVTRHGEYSRPVYRIRKKSTK